MRSEFLGAFQTHPFLLDPAYPEPFAYQEITVDPLPVDRFTEIIRGPADLVSLTIDDELVEHMVKETGTRDYQQLTLRCFESFEETTPLDKIEQDRPRLDVADSVPLFQVKNKQ